MIKRVVIVSGLAVLVLGSWAVAGQGPMPSPQPTEDPKAACSAMMDGQGVTAEGRAEMEQFMQSGKMTQAMTGMMEMASRMGGGDPMKGMVRMMEMMGSMGGMMGPDMMSPSSPPDHAPQRPAGKPSTN